MTGRIQPQAAGAQETYLPYDQGSAGWLHLTGITSVLSESCSATVNAALELARQRDAKVSFTVKYRALPWPLATVSEALEPLYKAADVVITTLRDARKLFNATEEAAGALQARWGGTVVVTDGRNGAPGCDGRTLKQSPAFETEVVDRLGADDAFAPGCSAASSRRRL